MIELEPVGIDFCEASKNRIVNVVDLRCSTERAFDLLADAPALPEWLADCKKCEWTSAPPYGEGSTRTVYLKGLTVRERFIAWERGKRIAFRAEGMTAPIATRLVEDFQLRSTGEGTCELTWTVHYAPHWLIFGIRPIVRFAFGRMFAKAANSLRRHVDGEAPR